MKKYGTLVFLVGLAALLLTQQKIVMPLVYDVISSDFFLVDSKDQASQLPISTNLTAIAFTNCNQHIKAQLASETSVTFSEKPLNAWSLGNYQYVINGEVKLAAANKANVETKKYVCRISYENGDDQSGVNDPENWTIVGLSGLETSKP